MTQTDKYSSGHLVLNRNPGESIRIGRDITIEVRQVKGQRVRLVVTAPKHVQIWRGELYEGATAPLQSLAEGQQHGTQSLTGRERRPAIPAEDEPD